MANSLPAEMAEIMTTDADTPPDRLDDIRRLVVELRDTSERIVDAEEKVRLLRERRKQIVEKDLVDVMDAVRVPGMTLDPEGNHGAFVVEVDNYYHANIAADWPEEKRQAAFAWIEKHHPGMLRNTITITCGKNTRAAQKKIEELAAKLGLPYKNEFGVPWNTLTSFVREQIEEEKKTPPLELLGATVGRVVKIKKAKEK